jgi:Lipoprotein confined to pathogenic Mycobacterium
MTDTPRRSVNRRRTTLWTVGVIVVVAVAFFVWLGDALSPDKEPPMKPEQVSALENELRAKGSAEDALVRYETALQQMADDVAALVPDLTWRWNRETGSVACPGPLMDTRGVQVTPRHIVFDGFVPDDVWQQALQRVRDRAAALGVTEVVVYADKPGHHDVAITGNNGAEIHFGTRIAASLSARSDCYLKQPAMSASMSPSKRWTLSRVVAGRASTR